MKTPKDWVKQTYKIEKEFYLHNQVDSDGLTYFDLIKILEEYSKQFTPKKESKTIEVTRDFFFKELKHYFCDINVLIEWLKIRKLKKAVNTETALKGFLAQVQKSNLPVQDVVKICVENSWKGFKAEWLNNISNNGKPTKQTRHDKFESAFNRADENSGTVETFDKV